MGFTMVSYKCCLLLLDSVIHWVEMHCLMLPLLRKQEPTCSGAWKVFSGAWFFLSSYLPWFIGTQVLSPRKAYTEQPQQQIKAWLAQPHSSPSESWFLEKGATHHVTRDIDSLSFCVPYNGHEHLQIGDGTPLSILALLPHCICQMSYMCQPFQKNLLSISSPTIIMCFFL